MFAWEVLDALSHQLELCRINAETAVVVLLGADVEDRQAALIRAAVARSGPTAIEVRDIAAGAVRDTANPLAAAVSAADVLIVCGSDVDSYGDFGDVRVLRLGNVSPAAFPPHASLGRRIAKLVRAATSGEVLRIRDDAGTDLLVELSAAQVAFDDGIVTADHPVAEFPAGWFGVEPAAGAVRGDIVLMPGDANCSAGRLIHSPVLLRIIDDHVSAIEGESADADILRTQLEYADDPAAYGIAGASIGMNPGAEFRGPFDDRLLHPVIGRLLAGVVGVSFGTNLTADRPSTQRIGFALRGRDVHIDDLPVVVRGQLDGDFAPDVYEL